MTPSWRRLARISAFATAILGILAAGMLVAVKWQQYKRVETATSAHGRGTLSDAAFVDQLGGPSRACDALSFYVRLPNFMVSGFEHDNAIWHLVMLDEAAAPALVRLVSSRQCSNHLLRAVIARELSRARSAGDHFSVFRQLMADESADVRIEACTAIGALGRGFPLAERVLRDALADADSRVRAQAVAELLAWGARDAQTMSTLMALKETLPLAAAERLGELRPIDARQAELLSELMESGDLRVRMAAAISWYKARGDTDRAASVLMTVVRRTRHYLQWRALDALARIGSLPKPVCAELNELLADPEPSTRAGAALALSSTPGDMAERGMAMLIRDAVSSDKYVRWCAVDALTRIGSARPDVIDALTAVLDRGSWSSTVELEATTRALAAFGPAARRALPGLVRLAEDPRDGAYAMSALAQCGRDAPEAIEALSSGLKAPSYRTRRAAEDALRSLGALAVTHVEPYLGDQEADVRRRAVRTIGAVGHSTPTVVARITALRKDPDGAVRRAAEEALRQFQQIVPAVPAQPPVDESGGQKKTEVGEDEARTEMKDRSQ